MRPIWKNLGGLLEATYMPLVWILKEFAENNNIDIILSSNQMLIGKSNMDVTDEILKNVNNKIKNFNIN